MLRKLRLKTPQDLKLIEESLTTCPDPAVEELDKPEVSCSKLLTHGFNLYKAVCTS